MEWSRLISAIPCSSSVKSGYESIDSDSFAPIIFNVYFLSISLNADRRKFMFLLLLNYVFSNIALLLYPWDSQIL